MTMIDKTKPVMVTGANGYVASWLVKRLLEDGLTVHAAVRNPENEAKVGHLSEIAKAAKGNLKFFKADLMTKNAYAEAMKDCELVYHTASPFALEIKDAKKDLLEPAEQGTANVLDTANSTPSVKRVVVTSSAAAMYTDAIDCQDAPNGELTEEVWNTTASIDYQPYSLSKTLAEKKAWAMKKDQNQWDVVTINPSFVMGPALNAHSITSESYNVLRQLGDGTMKMGVPKMGIGVVDVRDVAEAHYKAGFTENAKGRYITSGHNTNFLEMANTLSDDFGSQFPIPSKALPKWLLIAIGPMVNKLFSRKYIRNNVNIPFKANNSKIKNELNLQFRPLKESMVDSFQLLVDEGILKPKK